MMRRLFCLLGALLIALACAGAAAEENAALRGYSKTEGYVYLTLGSYPQEADGTVKPILWRVLTVDEEKAYLCSEYILFARPMHPDLAEYRDVLKGDFGQTELCHYLNGVFAEAAFTPEELDMLLPFEGYGKVFLLDAADLANTDIGMGKETSLKKSPGLRAWGTPYAIENNGYGTEQQTGKAVSASGEQKSIQKLRLFVYSKSYGAHSPYWVRNQSTTDPRHARCTKEKGQLGHIEVGRDNEGVRPALYLAMDSFLITDGDGSMEHPYQLSPAAPAADALEVLDEALDVEEETEVPVE